MGASSTPRATPPSPPSALRRTATRALDAARALWVRARNEHSAPHEVGLSVAAGVFSGCTPFLGLHMWIALGLATVFRLNRLWAFLGSRLSIVPVFLWIAFMEIELGHRLRAGVWVHMSPQDAIERGKELAIDWAIGTPLVGAVLATVGGLAAYAAARSWARREAAGRTPISPGSPAPEARPAER